MVYEIDKRSCDTLRRNITSVHPSLSGIVHGEKEGTLRVSCGDKYMMRFGFSQLAVLANHLVWGGST